MSRRGCRSISPRRRWRRWGGTGVGTFAYEPAATSGRGRPAAKFTAGYPRIPNSAAMQFSEGATFDLWVRIDSSTGMTGGGRFASTAWAMTVLAKSHDRTAVGFIASSPNPAYPGTAYGYVGMASFDRSWAGAQMQYTPANANVALHQWFRVTLVMSATEALRQYANKQLVYNCPNTRPSFVAMNARDLFIGRLEDNFGTRSMAPSATSALTSRP